MIPRYGRIRVSAKEERTLDGVTFASKKEMERYALLKMLQKQKKISNLELQPIFELQPGFVYKGKKIRPINYIADFIYKNDQGQYIIEDVKGMKTEIFILKLKMFWFKYPNYTLVLT